VARVEAVAPEERGAPAAVGRVLVIDDERGIRAALTRMLQPHEVVEADSGEQARALLSHDQRFDVILCDVMMPRGSGVEVHAWLLAQHPQLARKVVFLTGGAFTPNARAYLEQVDNLRVAKPFEPISLQRIVDERVAASQAKP
jgi:CheY-like chemotaxis protein